MLRGFTDQIKSNLYENKLEEVVEKIFDVVSEVSKVSPLFVPTPKWLQETGIIFSSSIVYLLIQVYTKK
jgi:hypothetical protein